jgi:hypothetical protein
VTSSTSSKSSRTFELNFSEEEKEISIQLGLSCHSTNTEVWENLAIKMHCYKKGSLITVREAQIEIIFCPLVDIIPENFKVQNKKIVSIAFSNIYQSSITLSDLKYGEGTHTIMNSYP